MENATELKIKTKEEYEKEDVNTIKQKKNKEEDYKEGIEIKKTKLSAKEKIVKANNLVKAKLDEIEKVIKLNKIILINYHIYLKEFEDIKSDFSKIMFFEEEYYPILFKIAELYNKLMCEAFKHVFKKQIEECFE